MEQPAEMKAPRAVKKKKDNFNIPVNKPPSKFTLNISLDSAISEPSQSNNIINISNISNIIAEAESNDPEIEEFKSLKAEYKKLKAELESNPRNEEKKKLKKKIKKRMKQIKENKLKNI
jgi:hypothetical protein